MKINLQLFAKSIEELAKEVINGKYGNGQARKNALGDSYSQVQSVVNAMLNGTYSPTKTTAPTTTTPQAPAPTQPTNTASAALDAKRQELLSQKPGDFTYEIHQSNWQTQIQETLDKILNREKFTYDLNGDALYQQYKDQYMLQGQQAMMDTMGQAQAMTGGYGNSYAQTVGQQTYQGYLQQLNDRVPELYQLALSQYNQEGQDLKDLYALYTDMDEREYDRAMDKIGLDFDIHSNKNADWWNQYDSLTNEYWNQYDHEYKVNRDAIADAETKKKYAYDTAMGMLSMGVNPSAEMLADAGISSSDASAIVGKVLEGERIAASNESKKLAWEKQKWALENGYKLDEEGNPIVEDEGGDVGWGDYSNEKHEDLTRQNGGSYYKQTLEQLKEMRAAGASNAEVNAMLMELVGNSYLSPGEYMSLYNKYRDNKLG